MKAPTTISLITFLTLTSARPTANYLKAKREVPQEQSHFKFLASVRTSLNLNNPAGIEDPVFGLLGNAAASTGAGSIANPDCLHQATADQAFTNAKAAGDVDLQAGALIYAALERNTGAVGQASVLCTETAVNPEIQALSQHQDPASPGAAATNKAITLELARQLAAVGADPLLALESGTFEPGQIGDPTGAGNTCNDADDPVGCIFTLNLLVEDATAEEIAAAVGGAAEGGQAEGGAEVVTPPAETAVVEQPAATDAPVVGDNGETCPAVSTVTVDPPAQTEAPAAGDNGEAAPVVGDNGEACPAVTTVTVDAPAATDGAAATETAAAPPAVTEIPAPAAGGQNGNKGKGGKGGNGKNGKGRKNGNNGNAQQKGKGRQGGNGNNMGNGNAAGDVAAVVNGNNIQTFTGALGGLAPAVVNSGAGARPFSVNNATFVNAAAAIQRSCAIQNNACANAFNSGALALPGGVADCNAQERSCIAGAASAARRARRA